LQKVAIDLKEDSLRDSDEAMTYYSNLTTYSSVANAAAKTRGEFDGTTLRNDEAHETAHLIDANTSLDESLANVEFS
jgi:hypothetical protein